MAGSRRVRRAPDAGSGAKRPTKAGALRRRARGGALLLGLVALLSGCAHGPDLERIYRPLAVEEKEHPLIVVPGVMGSRLVDARSGEEVWPGGFFELLLGRRFDELALPVGSTEFHLNRDALVPRGLFYEAVGQDFYARLVETLEGPAGYDCVPVSEIGPETDCVVMSWDWRRDLVEAARRLDDLVERLRSLRDDPDLKVDVAAHSAGGLITRYFLRYGGRDVLDTAEPDVRHLGGRKVHKAILIGTPNYGSISALQRAIMGIRVAIGRIRPEVMATMPSLYQLLPHPDRTWMIDVEGERLERELYELETWKEYAWSIFDPDVRERIRERFASEEEAEAYLADLERTMEKGLRRGKRFHRALSIPQESSPNEFVVFGGDCELTPARCLLERVDGEVKVRLYPHEVVNRKPDVDYTARMLEPGDGRVTKASLLARDSLDPSERGGGDFPLDFAVFVCEGHSQLTSNVTFRDNLLNQLLY